MPAGRPKQYNELYLQKAKNYLYDYDTAIPSVAGLALALGVARSTVYEWANEDEQFSDTLEQILTTQEIKALNGGITGDYNATITKLVLHNHGYSDKQETAHDLTDPMQELIKKVSGKTIGPA